MKNSNRIKLFDAQQHQKIYGKPKFNHEDRSHYFQLSKEEHSLVEKQLHLHSKLHLITQIGYFKAKQRTFQFGFTDIRDDLDHIATRYYSESKLPDTLPSRNTITQNNKRVVTFYGYTYPRGETLLQIKDRISTLTRQLTDPISVTRELMICLSIKKIILPEYRALQDLIGSAISSEEKRLYDTINQHLDEKSAESLNALLEKSSKGKYIIKELQCIPRNFKYGQMQEEVKKLNSQAHLYNISKLIIPKLKISSKNIAHYASLAEYYSTYHLSRFIAVKAHLYLICYFHRRFQSMHDHLIEAFKYYVEKYKKEAKSYSKEIASKTALKAIDDLAPASKALRFYNDVKFHDKVFGDICKEVYSFLPKERIESVCKYLEKKHIDQTYEQWSYYSKHIRTISKNLRPLFRAIDFDYGEGNQNLFKAVSFLKQSFLNNKALSKLRANEFPVKFIPNRLRHYIIYDKNVDTNKYEFLVYLQSHSGLIDGTISCKNSTQFRNFDDEINGVINWEDDKTRQEIIKSLDIDELTQPIDEILELLGNEIDLLLETVNKNILGGKNKHVKYKKSGDEYQWTLPYKRQRDEFNNPFYDRIPHIGISELLGFVDRKTRFMNTFKHITTRYAKSKINEGAIRACLIANATSLGTYKMGELSDLNYNVLHNAERNYIRLETLGKANDCIINKFTKLAIFEHYNVADNIHHANADGQKYRTRKDTLKSRYSPKYFGLGKGVVSYTSVMNNIAPATKVIGANEHESHHLQELIASNKTDLTIDCVATDTEGSNAINFALFRCMKIEFTPCYKTLNKKAKSILSFKDPNCYNEDKYVIRPGKKADKKLISKEWDNVKPIIASIMMKEADQSVLVKKLCSQERNSKIKDALWEYNDILMSCYLLKYIDDPNLRINVRVSLNRGEAYHQLKRKIVDANGGEFRGNSDVEIAIWNECGRLVANSVIYYNAYLLSELMQQKEAIGNTKAVAFICKLSPIACQHVNFNGYYDFKSDNNVVDITETLELLDKILTSELA